MWISDFGVPKSGCLLSISGVGACVHAHARECIRVRVRVGVKLGVKRFCCCSWWLVGT